MTDAQTRCDATVPSFPFVSLRSTTEPIVSNVAFLYLHQSVPHRLALNLIILPAKSQLKCADDCCWLLLLLATCRRRRRSATGGRVFVCQFPRYFSFIPLCVLFFVNFHLFFSHFLQGDLARKKIYPTIWWLYRDNLLPKKTLFFGYARSPMTVDEVRSKCQPHMKVYHTVCEGLL